MLKGKAKIELTNVKTGEKETYESENMITNFFNDILQCDSIGASFSWYLSNKIGSNDSQSTFTCFKKLTQGIVLWDDTLEEDASKYHSYDNNALAIGVANHYTYSGDVVSRGSFNEKESSLVVSSPYMKSGEQIKYVWDFNTSQAVGTIKSISLCPQYNIYSMPSLENQYNANYSSDYEHGDLADSYYSRCAWNFLYKALKNNDRIGQHNFIYNNKEYSIDADKLFKEKKLYVLSRAMLNSYNFLLTERLSQIPGNEEWNQEKIIEIPSELSNIILDEKQQDSSSTSYYNYATMHYGFSSDGKLRMLFFPNYQDHIDSTDTMYIWEIDFVNNYNSKVLTFTNVIPEGYSIIINNSMNPNKLFGSEAVNTNWVKGAANQVIWSNNYLTFLAVHPKSSWQYYNLGNIRGLTCFDQIKIMILNLNTGEVKEAYDNDDLTSLNKYYTSPKPIFNKAQTSVHGLEYLYFNSAYSINDYIYFKPLNDNTFLSINCNINTFINSYRFLGGNYTKTVDYTLYNQSLYFNKINNLLYVFHSMNNNDNIRLNPYSFCTINNLETPITKGNDQVMKITYTLTVD